MDNYKGIYANNNDRQLRYYEGGAHFRYSDLFKRLKFLKSSMQTDIEGTPTRFREEYQKPAQSRNIKPLIQSLTQKLSEIVNSSKERTKLNNTRNKIISSSVTNNLTHQYSQDKIKRDINAHHNYLNSTLSMNQLRNIKYLNAHSIANLEKINDTNNNIEIESKTDNLIESENKGNNIINNIIIKPNINISFVKNNNKVNPSRYGVSRNIKPSHSNTKNYNATAINYFSKFGNYTMQDHNNSNNINLSNTTNINNINGSGLTHQRNHSNSVFTKKYSNLQDKIIQMKMKTKIELEKLSKDFEKLVSVSNSHNNINIKKESRNKEVTKPVIYGNTGNYSNNVYYPQHNYNNNNNNDVKIKFKYNYSYQLQNEGEKRIQGRKGNSTYYIGANSNINKSYLANNSLRVNQNKISNNALGRSNYIGYNNY